MPFDEKLVYTYYREETVRTIIARALEETPSFTAVIAGNDVLAWQVVETLESKGIRVPQDCGVIGFDDPALLYQRPLCADLRRLQPVGPDPSRHRHAHGAARQRNHHSPDVH